MTCLLGLTVAKKDSALLFDSVLISHISSFAKYSLSCYSLECLVLHLVGVFYSCGLDRITQATPRSFIQTSALHNPDDCKFLTPVHSYLLFSF